MDYEASLKNIERLKNFIMPYDCQCIYFNFTSETEFSIQFFDNVSNNFMDSLTYESFAKKLPYVRILTKGTQEIFYYSDDNIHYKYDLIQNKVLDSYRYTITAADMPKIQEEFIQLFNMLKKIS